MRVRATAMGSFQSNAIGQIELSCAPASLSIGLFGLGSYAEGYATGALTHGTRFSIPYSAIVAARSQGDQLYLELDAPTFPHDRLVLSQFSAGPGVPILELRRRRLILHVSALSIAALACLAATILAPAQPSQQLAWGALGYGALAGCMVLSLGFALDQSLFVRPPGEAATRHAFVRELSHYVPHLIVTDTPLPRKPRRLPDLSTLLPRSATGIGLMIAATVLTAMVTGQRLLFQEPDRRVARESSRPIVAERPAPQPTSSDRPSDGLAPSRTTPLDLPSPPADSPPPNDARTHATIERRCLCDRADSQLWKAPIPKLSSLLIEKRSLQLKNYIRTHLEVGVINNGDTPISDITLHVQFFEQKGSDLRPTKERPLYFEGPLRPGQAIKWSTEARGTDFEIMTPDLGNLGPNGDGAAPADSFYELLEANHRPVRLHAARMLSFLGDPRAREAALHLKDAMRSAEAPYLRRILMATGQTRVCDVEQRQQDSTVGVCVYNASESPIDDLGVQLNELAGSLDTAHPLSDPPELHAQSKWIVPGKIPSQSGVYVRVPVPESFQGEKDNTVELLADRYDLLD